MSDTSTRLSQNKQGFTIVELLIVIVVIAILAAVTIVVYRGIQDRAYDSKLVSAVSQIENAMRRYSIDYGTTIYGGFGSTAVASGSPCIDGTGGEFAGNSFNCTMEKTFVARGVIPANFSSSFPPNKYHNTSENGRNSIYLYPCVDPGQYALYWTLRSPTTTDSTNINTTLSTCGHNASAIRDTWGMRAGKVIQL